MSRATRHHQALPEGYKLHWYVIESVLGQGGFGITYLARDTNLDQPVAIKEFLPVELATRADDSRVHPVSKGLSGTYGWGMERFLKEARTLAQFKHPNIVQVYTVFEANNTAYMIMEYERGRSLADALRFRCVQGEAALLSVLEPILDGLERIHQQGFIHRDIKPDNIYLREDGSPVLLDFGSARQALGPGTSTLTALVSPGFAPFEQYDNSQDGENKQGPWTDIYALAATMYCAIAGKGPPDAIARANAVMSGKDILVPAREVGAGTCSAAFLDAIDAGLAFHGHDRPPSIPAWRAMLRGDAFQEAATALPPGTAAPTMTPAPPRAAPDPGRTAGADAAARWERDQETLFPTAAGVSERVAAEPPAGGVGGPAGAGERQAEPAAPPAAAASAGRGSSRTAIVALALVVGVGVAAGTWFALGGRAPVPAASTGSASDLPPVATAPALAPAPTPAPAVDVSREVADRLRAGRKALTEMRLAEPPGDNAVAHFRAALALDPDNPGAADGLRSIAEQYLAIAERHLGRADRKMAEEYLEKAEAVLPGSALVAAARERLIGGKRAPAVPSYRPGGLEFATSPAPMARAAETVFQDCDECPVLVRVEAGTFRMGDDGDAGLPPYTGPAHEVTIDRAFAIGRDEVTFEQWDACVADRGCARQPGDSGWGRGDRPVVDVSFEHAREYVRWLSARTGFSYRLPSEAQWEFAARGTAGLRFPWGAHESTELANCWNCLEAGSLETTQPVGSYPPNALGLRDLAGNVWEWVEDCWNASFDGAPADGSAWVAGNCRLRVIKGGSWMNHMPTLSGANRGKLGATLSRNFVGLRVVREL